MSHTVARLEVSSSTYNEIKKLLEDAGYDHAFIEDEMIDMSGIAIKKIDRKKLYVEQGRRQ